ncbi:MAG: VWA domain-containing protein [Candidatus Sungbacteria bacterium]|nr:VWA domain-containing protein [Candidatus Sungbacteria bacterium]
MSYQNRVEVVLETDTTGSMRPCRTEVLKKFEQGLIRLFTEIPNLRVGLGFNGDYCDKKSSYVTRWHLLSQDIYSLTRFIRNSDHTDGGDLPECYELVLKEGLNLGWSADPQVKKVFVLAADDLPHPVNDPQNRLYNGGIGIDWRLQAGEYANRGIMICTVQCLSKSYATPFYRELAERTDGYHLVLDQFSDLMDLIIAICYGQIGQEVLQRWDRELAQKGRMTRSVDANFTILSRGKRARHFAGHNVKLSAVFPGRFQMLRVEKNGQRIDEFVEENALEYKRGHGFYEFTKPELIQEKKEVVLRDKITGDMFTGDEARKLIGLNPGERRRIKPKDLEKYDVFVQSTSYTRKLVGGTRFLYEVDLDR